MTMSFLINVRSLISFDEPTRHVEDELPLEFLEYEHEAHAVAGPARVAVTLTRARNGILAEGTVVADVELTCSRCLGTYMEHVEATFSETYALAGHHLAAEGEEESVVSEEGDIDVEPLLLESLVLAIPMKPLCSIECKGICPICGADLNEGACGCTTESIDPRLEVLKKLKQSG